MALVVRGLDLPRETREAHEAAAAALLPAAKDVNAPDGGPHAAVTAAVEWQRRKAAQRWQAVEMAIDSPPRVVEVVEPHVAEVHALQGELSQAEGFLRTRTHSL